MYVSTPDKSIAPLSPAHHQCYNNPAQPSHLPNINSCIESSFHLNTITSQRIMTNTTWYLFFSNTLIQSPKMLNKLTSAYFITKQAHSTSSHPSLIPPSPNLLHPLSPAALFFDESYSTIQVGENNTKDAKSGEIINLRKKQ